MRRATSRPPSPRRRGSSIIEVLVAMAILSIMVAGILQLFSLALIASAGSAARTELLFRCQQVVENIRLCQRLVRSVPSLPVPVGSGVPNPFVDGTTVNLPYKDTEPTWAAAYAFWGPAGANVIEESAGPYRISYSIARSSGSLNAMWIVTVTAVPTDDAAATRRFFGLTPRTFKRVDYVAAFP